MPIFLHIVILLCKTLYSKVPLTVLYFDASKEDEWIVIDGLQRLTAFQNYLVGKIRQNSLCEKYKFEGMQYLTDFNGKTIDDLPRQYVRRIKEASIIAYTVTQGTPDEIVFNIFQRINTRRCSNEDEYRHKVKGWHWMKVGDLMNGTMHF